MNNKVDILVLLDAGFTNVYYSTDYSNAYLRISDSMTMTISKPEIIDEMVNQLKKIKETLLLQRKLKQDSFQNAAREEKIQELAKMHIPELHEIIRDLPRIEVVPEVQREIPKYSQAEVEPPIEEEF